MAHLVADEIEEIVEKEFNRLNQFKDNYQLSYFLHKQGITGTHTTYDCPLANYLRRQISNEMNIPNNLRVGVALNTYAQLFYTSTLFRTLLWVDTPKQLIRFYNAFDAGKFPFLETALKPMFHFYDLKGNLDDPSLVAKIQEPMPGTKSNGTELSMVAVCNDTSANDSDLVLVS